MLVGTTVKLNDLLMYVHALLSRKGNRMRYTESMIQTTGSWDLVYAIYRI